ncbi:hypothetical protein GCM10027570_27180 [Streptomonospora sediminis]
MSPKKKRKTTARTAGARSSGGAPAAPAEETGGTGDTGDAGTVFDDIAAGDDAGRGPSGISRTPVVLDDRRRWPAAVWTVLAAVWVLGSAVFFVLFLAEGFALVSAADSQHAAGFASMNTAAWYLLGLVVCALLAPLTGTVWAALLRRRIAAILFGAALAASGILLFTLDSPAGIFTAIRNGISAG